MAPERARAMGGQRQWEGKGKGSGRAKVRLKVSWRRLTAWSGRAHEVVGGDDAADRLEQAL